MISMRLFHRCKHIWFIEGSDRPRIEYDGDETIRDNYVCVKCGRKKHKRRLIRFPGQIFTDSPLK